MKINFHRVLLGFFENWDKSSQKKWDKGEPTDALDRKRVFLIYYPNTRTQGQVSTVGSAAHS